MPKFKPIYIPLALVFVFLVLWVSGYYKKPEEYDKGDLKKGNKEAAAITKEKDKEQAEILERVSKLEKKASRHDTAVSKLEKEYKKLNQKENEILRRPAPATDAERSRILSSWYD